MSRIDILEEDVVLDERTGEADRARMAADDLRRIEEEVKKAKAKIAKQKQNNRRPYIIFDCPGQIELYTNYPIFKQLIHRLGGNHNDVSCLPACLFSIIDTCFF